MKMLVIATMLLMACSLVQAEDCPVPRQADVKKTDPVPLCLVAEKVRQALDDYNTDPKIDHSKLPPLSQADFDFKVARSTTGGLNVSFLVFTVGSTKKVDSIDDVTFTYKVPKKGIATDLVKQPAVDFSKELVATIEAAAEQIRQTDSIGAARFQSLTINLAYSVTWDFSAGISIPSAWSRQEAVSIETKPAPKASGLRFQTRAAQSNRATRPGAPCVVADLLPAGRARSLVPCRDSLGGHGCGCPLSRV